MSLDSSETRQMLMDQIVGGTYLCGGAPCMGQDNGVIAVSMSNTKTEIGLKE